MIGIEDLDEREEAARLLNAYRDACEAYHDEERNLPPLTQVQKIALFEASERYQADRQAIFAVNVGGARLANLKAQEDQTGQAYEDNPLALMEDDDGRPLRCGVSNVPLVDGDEIVEDMETGETFLRSAVGLPPREGAEEREYAEEEAEVEID